jgi:serpin B
MKYFQSDIETMDFDKSQETVKAINDFVSNKTHGMIENMLQSGDISEETSAVLVNCIYFKGRWAKPFDKNLTKSAEFKLADGSRKTTDIMLTTGFFQFASPEVFNGADIVELPYLNSTLTFTVVLPQEVDGLSKVVATARAYDWTKLPTKMTKMNIYLPKFNATFKQFLNGPFKKVTLKGCDENYQKII